jgi:putative aminopeptidase FrvX
MKDSKKFMEDLLTVYSPSGSEKDFSGNIEDVIFRYLDLSVSGSVEEPDRGDFLGLCPPDISDSYISRLSLSDLGGSKNTVITYGHGGKSILLSAHFDEVCMSVGEILDSGFIIPVNMGGFDRKVLPGLSVTVLSSIYDNGGDAQGLRCLPISGITQTNPIHVWAREENPGDPKCVNYSDTRIDIGCSSKEEVEELGVKVGDMICPTHASNIAFGSHKLYGNALDDKAGVWVVCEVMKRLKEAGIDEDEFTVYGALVSGEETGLRGIKTLVRSVDCQYSIDIDTTFGSDNGLLPSGKYGNNRLGDGPIITYGPDKDLELNRILESLAEKEGIRYQRCVSRAGGTDTDVIETNSTDCITTHIGLPTLSLHTPSETCDWRDLEGARDLILAWLKSL